MVFPTLGKNCGLQLLSQIWRKLVDFMAAINLDRLAGGRECDFAVLTLFQVSLKISTQLGCHLAI